MSIDHHPRMTDRQDTEIAAYQSLSMPAVVGLILGLFSPAAMLHPLLWFVPVLGIFFNGLALWSIARNVPAIVGRKAAVVGLVLSVFFGTAAVTDWFVHRQLLRRQADETMFRTHTARQFNFHRAAGGSTAEQQSARSRLPR